MPAIVSELGISWSEAALTVITAVGVYAAIVVFSRVFGQRQFATSSSFDLAFTFALGSLAGRVILVRTSLAGAVMGLATMFAIHATVNWAHRRSGAVHRAIQNRPVLLVAHGDFMEDNLHAAHTSREEVYQHVRLSGRGTLDGVAAVILERNGKVSVIAEQASLDARVLVEVRGHAALQTAGPH